MWPFAQEMIWFDENSLTQLEDIRLLPSLRKKSWMNLVRKEHGRQNVILQTGCSYWSIHALLVEMERPLITMWMVQKNRTWTNIKSKSLKTKKSWLDYESMFRPEGPLVHEFTHHSPSAHHQASMNDNQSITTTVGSFQTRLCKASTEPSEFNHLTKCTWHAQPLVRSPVFSMLSVLNYIVYFITKCQAGKN